MGPIFDFLTLEKKSTDILYRNVGKEVPIYAAVIRVVFNYSNFMAFREASEKALLIFSPFPLSTLLIFVCHSLIAARKFGIAR